MFLFYTILFYVAFGLCTYIYAVVKTWQYVGIWDFTLNTERVGICPNPKWLLFWLGWIVEKCTKENK